MYGRVVWQPTRLVDTGSAPGALVLAEVSAQVVWGTCGLVAVAHRHLVSPTGTCDCFQHSKHHSLY